MKNLRLFLTLLGKMHKVRVVAVLLMSIAASISEILSVSALIPLLESLLGDESKEVSGLMANLGLTSGEPTFDYMLAFCCLLIFSYCFRLLYLVVQNRVCYSIGQELCVNIAKSMFEIDYQVLNSRRSDFYTTSVTVKLAAFLEGFLIPWINITTSAGLLFGSILALWLFVGFESLLLVALVASVYLMTMRIFKTHLRHLSRVVSSGYELMTKYILVAKRGYREWKLVGSQKSLLERFEVETENTLKAHSFLRVLSASPRLIIEPLLVLALVIVGFIYSVDGEQLVSMLPVLAAVIYGMQRFMPYMQMAFSGWSYLRANEVSVNEFLGQIVPKEELEGMRVLAESYSDKKSSHNEAVALTEVTFYYPDKDQAVLSGLNQSITPGEWLGVVGRSGSGKSTLVDIVLGFLKPTSGLNLGCASKPSYVPQEIFVVNGTVAQNVALQLEESLIDMMLVHQALELVSLTEWVSKLDNGVNEIVTEDGQSMSGGQRQRLGIARAIYQQPDLLVLDEATSALDAETERSVISSLWNFTKERNIAVLFVSHRDAPLKRCDKILNMNSLLNSSK